MLYIYSSLILGSFEMLLKHVNNEWSVRSPPHTSISRRHDLSPRPTYKNNVSIIKSRVPPHPIKLGNLVKIPYISNLPKSLLQQTREHPPSFTIDKKPSTPRPFFPQERKTKEKQPCPIPTSSQSTPSFPPTKPLHLSMHKSPFIIHPNLFSFLGMID